ncbi:MAG TPA: methyltransferase, partial [Sulfurospirillum sp. UBA11407]
MRYISNTIDLKRGSVEEKRQEIRDYFLQTYALDEKLFEMLSSVQNIYEQPNKLRHPLIFYFGHTATFFMNKLNASNITQKRINKSYESIFAIGVDEMSWDDLNSENYAWPSIADTKAYRDAVKEFVLSIIDTLEFTMPINWDSPMWII